jgi:hypothetical protein
MSKILSRCLTALSLAAVLGSPLQAEEAIDTGAYLAARVAESDNDFRAASAWYARAIETDPNNPQASGRRDPGRDRHWRFCPGNSRPQTC